MSSKRLTRAGWTLWRLRKSLKREENLRFPDGLSPDNHRCRSTLLKMRRLALLQRSEEREYVELFLPLIQTLLDDRKDREGLFEYDDLLTRVHTAMNGAAGAPIRETLQSRFRFGLIDEFQDTDGRQWDIFRQIFVESDDGTLFVIGDPKQAIYGFRGADVQTYLKARKTLLEDTTPAAQYLSLRDNFRSTESLIDGVNLILDSSGERALLQGDIRYDTPVRCGRPERALIAADGQAVAPITLGSHPASSKQSPPLVGVGTHGCLSERTQVNFEYDLATHPPLPGRGYPDGPWTTVERPGCVRPGSLATRGTTGRPSVERCWDHLRSSTGQQPPTLVRSSGDS